MIPIMEEEIPKCGLLTCAHTNTYTFTQNKSVKLTVKTLLFDSTDKETEACVWSGVTLSLAAVLPSPLVWPL